MGVLSDLVVAPANAAERIRVSDNPTDAWDGVSLKGLDNVKIATLLSLLNSRSASAEYEKWLDELAMIGDGDGPWVFSFSEPATKLLATVAAFEEGEFDELAKAWGATDEFTGWQSEDVVEVLRSIGDLAETATLERKSLYLWVSL